MRRVIKLLLVLALVIGLVLLVRAAGPFLIIDQPIRSDILVMLGGDRNDVRLHRGEQLLRDGYAPKGLYDAVNSEVGFGRTTAQYAEDYFAHAPELIRQKITVCSLPADSTVEEMKAVRPCLERAGAHTVLLVTSDFHTRRALSTARKILAQYQWSVAAAPTAVSLHWWRSRAGRRDVLLEWQKLIWWKVIESHL